MTWLIVIILAGAMVWDVQSRWRAEQELRAMPWPNWMAAGDRADALQLVVGPLVVNVLLIAFFVSAAATGTRGEGPPLGSVLFTVLVFAGMHVSVNEYVQNVDAYHARSRAVLRAR